MLALYASWFMESLRQNEKTRFEEGFDQAPNLSGIVMLPFVTRIIARKLGNDPEGRKGRRPSILVLLYLCLVALPELDDVSIFHSIKVFYCDLYKIEALLV